MKTVFESRDVLRCDGCQHVMQLESSIGNRETWKCTSCFLRRYFHVVDAAFEPPQAECVGCKAPIAEDDTDLLCGDCREFNRQMAKDLGEGGEKWLSDNPTWRKYVH